MNLYTNACFQKLALNYGSRGNTSNNILKYFLKTETKSQFLNTQNAGIGSNEQKKYICFSNLFLKC